MTEEEEQEVGRGGYYYIVKPEDHYRNFKDSLKSSHSLETYSYALKEFMEYLGVAPSSLTTSSAASPSSPAYPYIHPYTDTDFAKLIEGKKGSITQIEDVIRAAGKQQRQGLQPRANIKAA